jgi:hypothetical protein
VKTLDHRDLDDDGAMRRYLLGGVVVEFRFHAILFWRLSASKFWSSIFFICFVRLSLITLYRLDCYGFIYKAGQNSISRTVLIGPDMWVYAVRNINDYGTPFILILKA